MKQVVKACIRFSALLCFGLPAAADTQPELIRKFLNYKIKNKTSALKTAEILALTYRKTPDQILARFIRAQFEQRKNPELAVVYGLEAYREQGLSQEQALTKVSDLIGQLPTTVEAMNNHSRFRSGARDTASTKKDLASR